MPEWIVTGLMLLMWAQGFVLGGMVYGRTPFWDGVRTVYSLGLYRPSTPRTSRE